MEDKDKQSESQDALEQTTQTEQLNSLEELSEGKDKDRSAQSARSDNQSGKQMSKKKGIKRLTDFLSRFFNVYMVIFIFLLVVGGVIFTVYYLNSRKVPPPPRISVEDLSAEAMREIAVEGQANIGDPDLLLNIQSNAVFDGQILARGDVNIAGNLRLGQTLSIPNITVSGNSNLSNTQINQLAVAGNIVAQGDMTLQKGLNIGGSAAINGSITAAKVTTSSLILSGTGTLEIGNHLKVNGPNPGRTVGSAVGIGGSASVSGSDTAGRVNINTGQNTAPGCFVTVNFTQRFGSAPRINLTPISPAAALTAYYGTTTPTGFSICTAQSAPTGSSLDFNYFIVE